MARRRGSLIHALLLDHLGIRRRGRSEEIHGRSFTVRGDIQLVEPVAPGRGALVELVKEPRLSLVEQSSVTPVRVLRPTGTELAEGQVNGLLIGFFAWVAPPDWRTCAPVSTTL